jgi:hypothetical protein
MNATVEKVASITDNSIRGFFDTYQPGITDAVRCATCGWIGEYTASPAHASELCTKPVQTFAAVRIFKGGKWYVVRTYGTKEEAEAFAVANLTGASWDVKEMTLAEIEGAK